MTPAPDENKNMLTLDNHLLLAFGLTLFAGLSTGVGSLLAFFTRQTNRTFLSVALGFSAGVMIYVSFMEILPKSLESLEEVHSASMAAWLVTAGFFTGIGFIGVIDRLVPEFGNPHEARKVEDMQTDLRKSQLQRMGVMSALAIAIHNFPEGLVTFMATLADPQLGVTIAFAVALHNIPEGIAVAVPIYYATGSRQKAFWYSLLSGLAEPAGALLGYFLLRPFFTPGFFGFIFAAVAGIMVFISLDELFPTAREYGKGHAAIYAVVAGMGVMAISLVLLD